mmetsp:Transcript_10548/g.30210  ORF Transcript_10548/g.30210 Transcript_10548/m.30210 type:complete len:131 (+) Transcript_10548:70-462(+)
MLNWAARHVVDPVCVCSSSSLKVSHQGEGAFYTLHHVSLSQRPSYSGVDFPEAERADNEWEEPQSEVSEPGNEDASFARDDGVGLQHKNVAGEGDENASNSAAATPSRVQSQADGEGNEGSGDDGDTVLV